MGKWPDSKIKERVRQDKHVIGAMIVDPQVDPRTVMEGCDLLLILFVEDATHLCCTSYSLYGSQQIKEQWLNLSHSLTDFCMGADRFLIEWLLQGEIIHDPQKRLRQLVRWVESYPDEVRQKAMCLEFSLLLRHHVESKMELEQGSFLDAFFCIQCGMRHWARLSAYQSNIYPQDPIWEQAKAISPEVYKLYEELVNGREPLEQRLRLIVLAVEFFIRSHLEECSFYLISQIADREEAPSTEQLLQQSWDRKMDRELVLMLETLVQRSLLKEVVIEESGSRKRGYQLINR